MRVCASIHAPVAVHDERRSCPLPQDDREARVHSSVSQFALERTAGEIVTHKPDDRRVRPAQARPYRRIRGAPARPHQYSRIVIESRGKYIEHEVPDREEPRRHA